MARCTPGAKCAKTARQAGSASETAQADSRPRVLQDGLAVHIAHVRRQQARRLLRILAHPAPVADVEGQAHGQPDFARRRQEARHRRQLAAVGPSGRFPPAAPRARPPVGLSRPASPARPGNGPATPSGSAPPGAPPRPASAAATRAAAARPHPTIRWAWEYTEYRAARGHRRAPCAPGPASRDVNSSRRISMPAPPASATTSMKWLCPSCPYPCLRHRPTPPPGRGSFDRSRARRTGALRAFAGC